MLSIAAQSARLADGESTPVARRWWQERTAAERFLLEWRGEADPKHVTALDTYWICTAEHGLNASTFTARITASTGADCGACLSSAVGALSGPLHGGAPARVLPMLDAAAEGGERRGVRHRLLDRRERLMGFGHRVYRAEDPRARLLKGTSKELGSPRYEVAEELERVALEALRERSPDRVARDERRVLVGGRARRRGDPAGARAGDVRLSRTAGWSAHILEQKRRVAADPAVGALRRPRARPLSSVS